MNMKDSCNPTLEKELNAGVPYYVIVSAYNLGFKHGIKEKEPVETLTIIHSGEYDQNKKSETKQRKFVFSCRL